MNFSFLTTLVGMGLVLLQLLAAVPWFLVLFARREVLIEGVGTTLKRCSATARPATLAYILGGTLVVAGLAPAIFNNCPRPGCRRHLRPHHMERFSRRSDV